MTAWPPLRRDLQLQARPARSVEQLKHRIARLRPARKHTTGNRLHTLRVQALIFGREHRPQLSIGDIVSITSNDTLRWAVAPISRPINASRVTPPQYRVGRRWCLRS